METNEGLRDEIFSIIENQLRDNNPPETKMAYDRLRKLGYDDLQTKQLIGQCVTVEIFEVINSGEPYDNDRYIKNLNKLPEEPFD